MQKIRVTVKPKPAITRKDDVSSQRSTGSQNSSGSRRSTSSRRSTGSQTSNGSAGSRKAQIHRPPAALVIPESLRSKGLAILNDRLSAHFSEEEIRGLEEELHTTIIRQAKRSGILDPLSRRFHKLYSNKLSNICLNLCPDSYVNNTYLLPAVKAGEHRLSDVARMTMMELNPPVWDKQLMNKKAETIQVAEGPATLTTSLIKCSKCGSNVSYKEEQTRSADEAMTIKAECPCGNRFNI